MQTIEGIFDGKTFILSEEMPVSKKYKVPITFVEELNDLEEIRNLSAQTNGFEFWKDEREDIYQDFLARK